MTKSCTPSTSYTPNPLVLQASVVSNSRPSVREQHKGRENSNMKRQRLREILQEAMDIIDPDLDPNSYC